MLLLVGCGGDGYTPELRAIDTIINEKPDSALHLLDSLSTEATAWPKSQRMRYSLLTMKAQNKAYVPFISDTIAKDLVSYYDDNGSPNDRLLARYLLGCVYRDLGEAPHAVDCYLDAVNHADTTATNCDFYTLSSVYSQLATVFYRQLLLSNEIDARKKASHYAFLANMPKLGIYNIDMIAGSYILMNKKDSAEIILKSVLEQYRKHGYVQQALRSSKTLMFLYTESPQRLAEAKTLMDQFECESELFNEQHELPPSQRQYYYYKGLYYEGINELDSAEYYYRKITRPNMKAAQKDPMYRGLLSVFKKRHQADSIAKYALLFCEANDSSIAKKDQELTAQMASLYNYNRYQREAFESEREAERLKIIFVSVVAILWVIGGSAFAFYRAKKQKTLADYRQNLESLGKIQSELQELCGENGDLPALIARKNEEISHLQNRILEYQKHQSDNDKANLEDRLTNAEIVNQLSELLNGNPIRQASREQIRQVTILINEQIPAFYNALNTPVVLRPVEYEVCMLIRCHFKPSGVGKLLGLDEAYVSNVRRRILYKVYGVEGNPKDLDERIMAIV